MVEFDCTKPTAAIPQQRICQSSHLPSSRFFICSAATPSFYSNMHTFKYTLLAVLSYVAMISATPLENRAPPIPPPICSVDPRSTLCLSACSINPDSPICSGYCANGGIGLPGCGVCHKPGGLRFAVCKGVCEKFPKANLGACRSPPPP